MRGSRSQKVKDVAYPQAITANAGPPATLARLDGDALENIHKESLVPSLRLGKHPLQFLHALLYLRFQLAEGFEDFARWAVRDFGVDDFLVAVEREVVASARDVFLWNEEGLGGARPL